MTQCCVMFGQNRKLWTLAKEYEELHCRVLGIRKKISEQENHRHDTIDNKIDKNWLQSGLDSYKIKCKDLFLKRILTKNDTKCAILIKIKMYFTNCTINH